MPAGLLITSRCSSSKRISKGSRVVAERLAGPGFGVLIVFHDHDPIHQHIREPSGIVMWIAEGCMLPDFFGIENHEVSPIARSKQTAVSDAKACRRQRGHPQDRIL